MNVMRRGLLMILIAGLVFPAPAALAVNVPSDNTESSAAEHAAAQPETAAESAVVKSDTTSVAQAQPVAAIESEPPATPPAASSAPETSPAPAAPASVAQTAAPQADALTSPSAQAAAADSSTIPPPKVLISKVKIGPGAEEFVELYNAGNEAVNLKGWRLQFLKEGFTGGIREQTRILKDFGDAALKPGEFYAVRHSKNEALSEIREVFDDSYKSGSLAANGSVRLVTAAGGAADLIGWNKAAAFEKFAAKIDSKKQNVLQRCIGANVVRDSDNNADDFTAGNEFSLGQFINCAAPEPPNPPQPSQPSDQSPPDNPHEPTVPPNACANIKLTEIGANLDDQFIEIYNAGDAVANLNGCKLTISSNKKQYGFGDSELVAHDFLTVNVKEAGLKLGKTTGTVRILSSSGETVDEIYYEKLPKNTSWSLVDDDWMATYAFTPGRGNVAELWLPCPIGKIRNELTGKCVKEKQTPVERELQPCQPWQYRNPETGRCKNYAKVATVKPCKDGQYRSEETGRCRSIAAAAAKVLKPCRDDQFRDPKTGRCKKIASADKTPKPCKDGWERNPETNRCRKKKSESVKLTSYPVESDTAAASSYAMWWAVGGITAAGSGYAGWEWRREITRLFRRIRLPWQK